MKKLILFFLMILLLPSIESYNLSNSNYKLSIGIVSGKALSNDNYKLKANIYPLQSELENTNYKLKVGYLYGKKEIEEIEEEPIAGAGASGAAGARGGTCDVFADQNQRCYYPNQKGECVEGCPQGYKCNKYSKCTMEGTWKMECVYYFKCIPKEYWKINTPYYFISVDVQKEKYKKDTNMTANITLVNKQNYADENGILLSYLEDKDGIRYKQEKIELKSIPSACRGGEYENNICINNTTLFEPNKTLIIREMDLLNITPDKWKFYISYKSKNQPLITLYDEFKIYSRKITPWLYLSLIPVFLIFVKIMKKKKRRRKLKKKKKELEEPIKAEYGVIR